MASTRNYLQIISKGHADSTSEAYTKKVYNVWTYRRAGSQATPNKSNIITAWIAACFTPLKACLSENYLLDEISVRFIDDSSDPYLSQSSALSRTVTGDSLPSLMAVCMQLKTGVRAQIAPRGSKHFAVIPESHTDLDSLNATGLALWQTFATAYLNGFTSDTFNYVPFVASARPAGSPFDYQTVTGNDVTSVRINPILGSMMKRRQPVSQ